MNHTSYKSSVRYFHDRIKRGDLVGYELLKKLPTQGRHFYFYRGNELIEELVHFKLTGYILTIDGDILRISPYYEGMTGLSEQLQLKDGKFYLIPIINYLTVDDWNRLEATGEFNHSNIQHRIFSLDSIKQC